MRLRRSLVSSPVDTYLPLMTPFYCALSENRKDITTYSANMLLNGNMEVQCCYTGRPAGSRCVLVDMQSKTTTYSGEMMSHIAPLNIWIMSSWFFYVHVWVWAFKRKLMQISWILGFSSPFADAVLQSTHKHGERWETQKGTWPMWQTERDCKCKSLSAYNSFDGYR